MTRDDILKDLLSKSVLPLVIFSILFLISKAYFTIQGEVLYLNIWIYCSFPFGIWQMFSWIDPSSDPKHRIGLTLFNIAFGMGFGGFFILGKLAVALWYVPLSLYRLLQWNRESKTGGKMKAAC